MRGSIDKLTEHLSKHKPEIKAILDEPSKYSKDYIDSLQVPKNIREYLKGLEDERNSIITATALATMMELKSMTVRDPSDTLEVYRWIKEDSWLPGTKVEYFIKEGQYIMVAPEGIWLGNVLVKIRCPDDMELIGKFTRAEYNKLLSDSLE